MIRDPHYTAAVIRSAAAAAGLPAEGLVRFAEARAAHGGLEVNDYDFPVEAMQEAGDGANYCGWDAQEVIADPGPNAAEELHHLQQAIQGFAQAYHHAAQLRHLRRTT